MFIGKPFRYMFFLIYQWNEEHAISGKVPNAVAGVAFLLGLNVLAALQLMLLLQINNFATQLLKLNARLTAIVIFIPLCWIIWWLFVASDSYKKFIGEFQTKSTQRLTKRNVIFALYVVFTVCLPFCMQALIRTMRPYG
jgi:hypothetical protein